MDQLVIYSFDPCIVVKAEVKHRQDQLLNLIVPIHRLLIEKVNLPHLIYHILSGHDHKAI